VAASPPPGGTLAIADARSDVPAVNAAMSRQWLSQQTPAPSVQLFTFNTPLTVPEAQKCGRVVYSDLHSNGGVGSNDQAGQTFPAGCSANDLTAQQKALEFTLFDLTSCVQADATKPIVPPLH
jgi:hypothetical protein